MVPTAGRADALRLIGGSLRPKHCLCAMLAAFLFANAAACNRSHHIANAEPENEYLGKLDAARAKYDADKSPDNLASYYGLLRQFTAADGWQCKVTSTEQQTLADSSPDVEVHGICGADTKVELNRSRPRPGEDSAVFDALHAAKPGDTLYFTGALDLGNLSFDHFPPPPAELTFAVVRVGK